MAETETTTELAASPPLAHDDDPKSRRDRKEEGKRLKRQRIEESGGVRPRGQTDPSTQGATKGSSPSHSNKNKKRQNKKQSPHQQQSNNNNKKGQHRFGQVMDQVPCRNRARFSTVTIALPGSVLSNCQTRELKTHLVGQIARACTIYHVDEIVVFDDKLSKNRAGRSGGSNVGGDSGGDMTNPFCSYLARLLQYCECPQYLRRDFFPRHPDLQFAGLLPPIDAPHHVRMEDRCKYREGVVMEEKPKKEGGMSSLVNCGIRNRPIEIDRSLPVGIRCTVQVDIKDYGRPGKRMSGKVVSPSAPREDDGTYWGYTTRIASSIQNIFDECPFEGGYDLKVGTSERGDVSIEDKGFALPRFRHSLIVFGGVAGIEECVDADETTKLPGARSKELFDLWVNVCPFQGSRTIRTEEAVLLSLAKFNPLLAANVETSEEGGGTTKDTAVVEFSDGAVSDESSGNDSD